MQQIWYANDYFLTDDRIAEALMAYASVLAVVDSADVVRLPGVDRAGTVREVQMVVGPASQILAMPTSEPVVDMAVDETVADLEARARRRLPHLDDVVGSTDVFTDDEGRPRPAQTEP